MKVTAPSLDNRFEHVSDTALIIARIRGRESTRPDRLFNDHFAFRLAGARGEELGRASESRWLTRLLSKSMQSAVVLRTAIIDQIIEQAVRSDGIDCVVNLGAGLDTRPYRLDLPANLQWIEVDFPDVIAEKTRQMEGETPRCQVERRALDLRQTPVRAEFFAELKLKQKKVLVLTEGLLLYLEEAQVRELADQMRKACVQRWVTDLNSPNTLKAMAKVWSFQLGQNIQFQFGHESGSRFFAGLKWKALQELPVFEQRRRFHRETSMTKARAFVCKILGEKFTEKVRRSSVILELTPIEFSK